MATNRSWRNAYIIDISATNISVSKNISVSGTITPSSNHGGSLGTHNIIWGNAYIQDISASNISVSGNISIYGTISVSGGISGSQITGIDSIDGDKIDFSSFKGKKILIVNKASKCGYTPQYADLERLHKAYKDKLVIVGFPANNCGGQEPGSNEQIAEFCQKNYGVSFIMAEKVSVICL
jgi:hypothetical protein